ncbi:NAD(P)H-quinone oxidoreductase [Panacibacter sp. DH6]|uniref:NAD(P)H-quinone oxidoreductase n=1 Tax=Panacibacter microcysteis TaxID=2793269 RepID=A0A931GXF2_9BACT|nr:NAD(P)H-quinone oxidoreductase [Panacibacter microcysteis]MBG9375554.1 NAD(P)H-quinone oxidoreductase [Panacibacter microcysteis]
MKAIIITTPGAPEVLQLQERAKPVPKENEVLIQVKAAGVNRPDVIQRKGKYPPPPGVPADIPGLEIAGIVASCGSAVKDIQPGHAVCALVGGGGYATYVTVHAAHCLPVPHNMNFIQAASLPETVLTVWHNVFQRGRLERGEKFLVHGGSSGIGITAIQLARAFGAIVFATAGSREKCDACIALGAENCINYKAADFEVVLKDQGIDVILDMIGGDYTEKNIRLLNTDGRLVFINAMKGGAASFDAVDIMRRRLTITGSTLRNRDNEFKTALIADVRQHVWPVIEAGKFTPVIHKTFALADAAAAHTLMESSEHIGKIILVTDHVENA